MSVYRQGDPAWGHVTLGYGPDTIGESGCYLTTFAQILSHYGFSVNPLTLNQIIKDAGRWVNGDMLSDAAISGLANFPGVQFVTKYDYTNRPADLSVLTNNATDEYAIEIDFDHNPNDGIQTHFVRFVSWDGHKLIIDDPEYGSEENFADHYGTDLATTILKIVKYTGPAVPAPAAPQPAPNAPAAFDGAIESVSGNAHVVAPAYVRTGPGTSYPLNTDHSSGKLIIGTDFVVKGRVTGQDPYGDGRNVWYESQFGNFVWGGNLTVSLNEGKGGEEITATATVVPAAEAATEPVQTAETVAKSQDDPAAMDVAAPAVDPEPETISPETEPAAEEADPAVADAVDDSLPEDVTPIGMIAWLKPVLNDHTQPHEGAPVINIETGEPVEVVPMEAKVPFVAYKNVNGINYFKTQHMIDNKLNYGIEGTDLQQTEAPSLVIDAIHAGETAPAADQPDQYIEEALAGAGKVWSRALDFITRHHPNNQN